MRGEDIGVGIVGFGLAGRVFHAPLVNAVEGLRVAGIVARTNAADARALYPNARVVSSLGGLLEDKSVRVVVVASPNATHAKFATEALEADRHVVIDKPFATSSAEAEKLIARAAERKRVLTVFHNRRWDGDYLTARSLIEAGTLGRVVLFESHFDRYAPKLNRAKPWKEVADGSGGLLWDLGPHLVDQALQLFGIPQRIYADVRSERTGSVTDDAFDILFQYDGGNGGVRVLLRSSMLAAEPGPRFVVRGEEGTFTKSGLDPQEAALRGGASPVGDDWGREQEEHWGTLTQVSESGKIMRKVPTLPGDYREFYRNLREVLRGREQLAVTPQQALTVMRVLELARESSAKGESLAPDAECTA
jgi:scyllo-inositol 2-dehydrogenase (NADP+)